MKRKRRYQRPRQPTRLLFHHIVLHPRQIQSTQHTQQQDHQRSNPRKPQPVKLPRLQPTRRPPSPNARRSNQIPRHRKEHLHPKLSIPHQRVHQLQRQPDQVRYVAKQQLHIHVIHQHKEDRRTTQQINPIHPRPSARPIPSLSNHRLSVSPSPTRLCKQNGRRHKRRPFHFLASTSRPPPSSSASSSASALDSRT